MIAFLKLIFFGLVGLSIVYLSLSVFSASLRRERLEKEYDADPESGQTCQDYVETCVVHTTADADHLPPINLGGHTFLT